MANYNSLSTMVDGFIPTSVEEVIIGQFPWSLLAGMYVLAKLQVMCVHVHVQCVGQRRSVEMQKNWRLWNCIMN